MKNRIFIFLLLVSLFISGCMPQLSTLTNKEKALTATDAATITFSTNSSLPQQYEELGQIITVGSEPEEAIENLKEKAAEMGANKIINGEVKVYRYETIRIFFIPFYADGYLAYGTAVKTN